MSSLNFGLHHIDYYRRKNHIYNFSGPTGSSITGPTGSSITGPTGTFNNYLSIYDTTIQNINTENVWQDISFNNISSINKWTQNSSTDFKCNESGYYSLSYTAVMHSVGGSSSGIVKICLDDSEIIGSSIFVNIQSTSSVNSCSKNIISFISTNQIVNLQFAGTSTSVHLDGSISPFTSSIPTPGPNVPTSCILNIIRIA
jgi:hypothetical protein